MSQKNSKLFVTVCVGAASLLSFIVMPFFPEYTPQLYGVSMGLIVIATIKVYLLSEITEKE